MNRKIIKGDLRDDEKNFADDLEAKSSGLLEIPPWFEQKKQPNLETLPKP